MCCVFCEINRGSFLFQYLKKFHLWNAEVSEDVFKNMGKYNFVYMMAASRPNQWMIKRSCKMIQTPLNLPVFDAVVSKHIETHCLSKPQLSRMLLTASA